MPPPVRAAARFAIAYRTEGEEDEALLAALHASGRGAAFAALGWPEPMLAAILDPQGRAQEQHYQAAYPGAERLVIEQEGIAAGRIAYECRADSLHLIDIALLPERRGAGVGGAILTDLVAHADAQNLPVSLHVEAANPARRLYERLGFQVVDAQPLYLCMERPAGEPRS